MLVGRAVAARRHIMLTSSQLGAEHVAGTAALADEILRFDSILAATAGGAPEPGGKNSYYTLTPRFLNWSSTGRPSLSCSTRTAALSTSHPMSRDTSPFLKPRRPMR